MNKYILKNPSSNVESWDFLNKIMQEKDLNFSL